MARAVQTVDLPPEPDRFGDYPHPRVTNVLFGQEQAEQDLLRAYRSGRMHHGWLFQGTAGIGKATLAYRLAKFILANPDPAARGCMEARDLGVAADLPAVRQVVAQAHPDLFVLRRAFNPKTKTVQSIINVDLVRSALQFFTKTAAAGGWRILLVDCADDLNINAANALLKTLEEPPPRSLLLLIANNAGRLLATIRSRCRRLTLQPLNEAALEQALRQAGGGTAFDALGDGARAQLFDLACGSAKRALSLLGDDLLALHRDVSALIAQRPPLDAARLHRLLADASRPGKGEQMSVLLDVIDTALASHVAGLAHIEDSARLARLAQVWENTRRLAVETDIFHFDRKQAILNVFRWIEAANR